MKTNDVKNAFTPVLPFSPGSARTGGGGDRARGGGAGGAHPLRPHRHQVRGRRAHVPGAAQGLDGRDESGPRPASAHGAPEARGDVLRAQQVTESARACSYFFRKQVLTENMVLFTCWLSTFGC